MSLRKLYIYFFNFHDTNFNTEVRITLGYTSISAFRGQSDKAHFELS